MTRREAVSFLFVGGLAWAAQPWSAVRGGSSRQGALTLSPELTEGPYYLDLECVRRDITEGKPGVPLRLRVRVVDALRGRPVPKAAVDVWHCDAQGFYSGFNSHGPGQPPGGAPPPGGPPFFALDGSHPFPPAGPPGPNGRFRPPPFGHPHKPDNALTFLRGVQMTDPAGWAEFATIFPGWYQGRTTHIHVRVHDGGYVAGGRYAKGHISHTGQIFFPEGVTNTVYGLPAYQREVGGRMALSEDGIFRAGGSLLAETNLLDPRKPQLGLVSETLLFINPKATPAQV